MNSPQKQQLQIVVAKYDFSEECMPIDQHVKSFLSFTVGDEIVVVRESTNYDCKQRQWMKGYVLSDTKKSQGWFPSTFVSVQDLIISNQPLFGTSFTDLVLIENRCIPWFIESACTILMKSPKEGQFRQPGNKTNIDKFREQLDTSGNHQLKDFSMGDARLSDFGYEIAGLLKCMVSELPEPIIDLQCEGQLIYAISRQDKNCFTKMCKAIIENTSLELFIVFRYLMQFCFDYLQHEVTTKISQRVLCQMFGIYFFDRRPNQTDRAEIFGRLLTEFQNMEHYFNNKQLKMPAPSLEPAKVTWRGNFLNLKRATQATVLSDFTAPSYLRKCASVKAKDVVMVREQSYSWALVEFGQQKGWVPNGCLDLVTGQ